MKKLLLLTLIYACSFNKGKAQNEKVPAANHPDFPQSAINNAVYNSFTSEGGKSPDASISAVKSAHTHSALSIINKMNEVKKMQLQNFSSLPHSKSLDTVFVGAVPHDTLIITGQYVHTGPIFVFNNGVLIIRNASVTEYGDVYVFQTGKVIADSSSLTFPQQYFYQRSFIVVQHGSAYFNSCSFNYSGMSHNLVIGDSGLVSMNNIHQRDWTTAGLFGSASIQIHGLNLGGEYILSDKCNASFNHVDTLLLWHQLPNTAVVNYSFPQGDTVPHYVFNNTTAGVAGINYHVNADTCYNVWWALMPVNGSNITLSNSNIRAVGAWFQHRDSVSVTGLVDNTFYSNTVLPLSDRHLHLMNCNVQTWSLYAFDSSHVNISGCTLGEVGTQQHAQILSQQFLLDGSGGYFWATDTSTIFASNTTVYSTARSERNGIFVLSYSTLPFQGPSSIGSSLLVSVQNSLAADPIPYDGSIAWMENIESPSTAHSDSLISIRGSAWIDQGPQGSWMDFTSYSMYYQRQGAVSWTKNVRDSLVEIRHSELAKWNTAGLSPGTYILRLLVKNTLGDSVEDFKNVTVLAGTTIGINENPVDNLSAKFFPNPAKTSCTFEIYLSEPSSLKICITDIAGKEKDVIADSKFAQGICQFHFDTGRLADGIYLCRIVTNNKTLTKKIVIQH